MYSQQRCRLRAPRPMIRFGRPIRTLHAGRSNNHSIFISDICTIICSKIRTRIYFFVLRMRVRSPLTSYLFKSRGVYS